MQRFSNFLIEDINKHTRVQWTNSVFALAMGISDAMVALPVSTNTIRMLNKHLLYKRFALHVTNEEGYRALLGIQKTKKALSVSTEFTSSFVDGGVWRSGVDCLLYGQILVEADSDIMSVPDIGGRRWVPVGYLGDENDSYSLQFRRELRNKIDSWRNRTIVPRMHKVYAKYVNVDEILKDVQADELSMFRLIADPTQSNRNFSWSDKETRLAKVISAVKHTYMAKSRLEAARTEKTEGMMPEFEKEAKVFRAWAIKEYFAFVDKLIEQHKDELAKLFFTTPRDKSQLSWGYAESVMNDFEVKEVWFTNQQSLRWFVHDLRQKPAQLDLVKKYKKIQYYITRAEYDRSDVMDFEVLTGLVMTVMDDKWVDRAIRKIKSTP